MLYVVNDIHGDPLVSKKVADFSWIHSTVIR